MMNIGKVEIDLSCYDGSDYYSDGGVENIILEACKAGSQAELLKSSNEYAVLYHLSDIRHNLLDWYPISDKDDILEIGSGCGGITTLLCQRARSVTCVELSKTRSLINAYRNKEKDNILIKIGNFQKVERSLNKYDIVTLIGVWEYSSLFLQAEEPFLEMLIMAKKHLKENGKIIIAIENKMGLKYWNGSAEDHTGKPYSGINGYTEQEKVRTFSKIEIEKYLGEAGISNYSFYYPLPDYKLPNVIYSDRYLPNVGDLRFFGREYQKVRLCNFNEAIISDQICKDGQFPYFSNSFLVVTGVQPDTIYAKYQRERKRYYRFRTLIKEDNNDRVVIKSELCEEAKYSLRQMYDKFELWKGTIPSVTPTTVFDINDNKSEYIDGESLEEEFYEERHNINRFIDKFNYIKVKYLTPINHNIKFYITDEFKKIFGEISIENSTSAEYTNVDLILSNLKRDKTGAVKCFDPEWIFDFPIPFDYPIYRAAYLLYEKYAAYLKSMLNRDGFLMEVGFEKNKIEIYKGMERHFMEYVAGKNFVEEYTKKYKKSVIMPNFRLYG